MRTGRYEEAEATHREALQLARQTRGETHTEVAIALANVGLANHLRGRYAEAKAYFRDALDMFAGRLADDHPNVLATQISLAGLHQRLGDLESAEELYRQVLAKRRSRYPAGHLKLIRSLNNLAVLLKERDALPEARSLYTEALEMARSALGDDHSITGAIACSLGSLELASGSYVDAGPWFHSCQDVLTRQHSPDHPSLSRPLIGLGRVALDQGEFGQAVAHFRRATTLRRQGRGAEHWRTAEAELYLARALIASGKDIHEAKALLDHCKRAAATKLGPAHEVATKCREAGFALD